ncbi:unnamed protein product [Cyprideis torosa]|uniref:Uncharacterized protein n=1 Tax=Cyprideis torosa TaxID=163714 RepID=A0A7R8WJH3_9CRUS|nr:unnamed protein product [Cyprideis torosa]CAG0895012.1 unnamed protein product [Cyprideis torosa]
MLSLLVHPTEVVGVPKPGRKLVFLGDSCDTSLIESQCQGADLVVHETTMENAMQDLAFRSGHSTPAMAAKFARDVGARVLAITHFSPRYKPFDWKGESLDSEPESETHSQKTRRWSEPPPILIVMKKEERQKSPHRLQQFLSKKVRLNPSQSREKKASEPLNRSILKKPQLGVSAGRETLKHTRFKPRTSSEAINNTLASSAIISPPPASENDEPSTTDGVASVTNSEASSLTMISKTPGTLQEESHRPPHQSHHHNRIPLCAALDLPHAVGKVIYVLTPSAESDGRLEMRSFKIVADRFGHQCLKANRYRGGTDSSQALNACRFTCSHGNHPGFLKGRSRTFRERTIFQNLTSILTFWMKKCSQQINLNSS